MIKIEWPGIQYETIFGDRVVKSFNDRVHSLSQMLSNARDSNPTGVAVCCEDKVLTYSQLWDVGCVLSQRMIDSGISSGDRVALLLNNRVEFVVSLFAITFAGAICVPISVRESKLGVSYAINQCKASMVIHEGDLLELLPSTQDAPSLKIRLSMEVGKGAEFYFDWIKPNASNVRQPQFKPVEVSEQDTAIILYTSGTTGLPKGAMLSHFGLIHSSLHFKYGLGLNSDDCAVSAVPLSHVTGIVALITCVIMSAAKLVIMPSFKASNFLKLAQEHGMTYTLMVPAMYNLCLLDPYFEQADLSKWRIGGFGGAPMPIATIEQLKKAIPPLTLMNCYGATETSSPITLMPKGEAIRHIDSVGLVLPCAELLIMDADGREVVQGGQGEIWIRGPMVIKGYWENDQATRENFTAGFWKSGDIGSIDEQGYLRVFDRIKDMINRGGYKIYTTEVENVISQHPNVLECAVIAKPCPVLGERVHSFVTLKKNEVGEAELREFCAKFLADYKVPESFSISRELLPRNANGKLLKRKLRDMLQVS